MAVDLNADLGEGFDDEAMLAVVTSANVACGFHAGDERTMRRVTALAAQRGVVVGAHVSYADREHFGRRALDVAPDVLAAHVREQLRALDAVSGGAVRYVKPHGALYNTAVRDRATAAAVVDGVRAVRALPILGMPGSELLAAAEAAGLPAVTEGFPDRAYAADGTLLPRDAEGALIADPEEIARRSVELSRRVRSVCVHGDSPGAVDAARRCRSALEAAGLSLEAFA